MRKRRKINRRFRRISILQIVVRSTTDKKQAIDQDRLVEQRLIHVKSVSVAKPPKLHPVCRCYRIPPAFAKQFIIATIQHKFLWQTTSNCRVNCRLWCKSVLNRHRTCYTSDQNGRCRQTRPSDIHIRNLRKWSPSTWVLRIIHSVTLVFVIPIRVPIVKVRLALAERDNRQCVLGKRHTRQKYNYRKKSSFHIIIYLLVNILIIYLFDFVAHLITIFVVLYIEL